MNALHLNERPSMRRTGDEGGGGGAAGRLTYMPPAKVALAAFLCVVTMLFFLLTLAYIMRAQYPDWQSLAGHTSLPLSDATRLWLNTALLLASSVSLQWASVAAGRGQLERMRTALLLAGLFALAFLLGQLTVWQQLAGSGYFVSANPAASFFYLITGLHGLHLTGGLVAWGITSYRAWRGVVTPRVRLHVSLCAMYWHFLFFVWLLMFGLLASSPETIDALAALCGLR
jgi:cytochrome c oxidase subunit 3